MLYTHVLEMRSEATAMVDRQIATCTKEMSLTPEHFVHSLSPVLEQEGGSVEQDDSQVTISNGARRAVVRFSRQPDRRLGSLILPVLKVDMRFEGYTGNEIKRFSDKFDLTFMRMGG